MADNWKNNILPSSDSLDLGSLAYDKNTSLPEITSKYTDLGSQVNSLANAAAEDVHTRQVKLIGNDFGKVNPMMYGTYYQPEVNDIQSEIRIKGTEKAFTEGMERGKAAAEAELASAKNQYSSALDSYKNAKEAFSNLKVVTNDPNQMPEGVTEDDMMSYDSFTGDRETARSNIRAYTDAQDVDWSHKDIWSHAAGKTIDAMGVDTTNWGKSEWDQFWGRQDVGRVFSNNYISEYIGTYYGEDRKKAYDESYTAILNKIDEVFDYINGITDILPEAKIDNIFYLPDNPTVELSTGDSTQQFFDNLFSGGSTEEQKYLYTLAYYTEEKWIREHIADEYQEEVLNKAKELNGLPRDTYKYDANGMLENEGEAREAERASKVNKRIKELEDSGMTYVDAYNQAKAESGKEYYEYIQTKLKQSEVKEVVKRNTSANEVVSNLFGFSVDDMKLLSLWKKENPDEYESYKNQLAQINGLSNTFEVADGERYYWTGSQYEQLAAGTPVFFAYNGAIDKDGNILDEDLKKFVELWNDFYSADVEAIGDDELSTKKDALNQAYINYMQHVSAANMINSVFNVQITQDIYREIVASFSGNISESEQEIEGVKIKDIIKEFNDMDQGEKYRAYTDLVKAAYSGTDKFLRYTDAAGGIVSENINYSKDSDAAGYSKLDPTTTFLGVSSGESSKYANMTAVEAVPYFLAIARSMEQYNKGTTTGNIDPSFMNENFFQYVGADLGQQAKGALDFWGAALAFAGGIIAAPINLVTGKDADPTHNEFFGIKGLSAANVIGGAFTGTREYNMDDPWQRDEYLSGLEKRNREYAASVINPILIDVYFGDQDISEVRGLGDKFTSEGGGMFRNWDSFWKTGMTFADMFAINFLEGKAIGAIASGASYGISAAANSKMAARLQLSLMPAMVKHASDAKIVAGKITALSNTIGEIGGIIDNIDDPKQLVDALRMAASELDDLGIDATSITKALEHPDDLDGLRKAAQELSDMRTSGLLDNAANTLKAMDSGQFGMLSSERAAALSALSTNDLSSLLTDFGEFARAASKNPSTKAVRQSLAGLNSITLATGETVSAFDATMVVTANRITGVMTLASSTGLTPEALAALPDSARQILLRTLNGMTSMSQSAITDGSLRAFLKSMSPDDFKSLVSEFVSRNEVNMSIGKKWDIFDTYRAAAAAGWERSGVTALTREFLTDALTDPLRDFKRNVSIPQVDQEGNVRVQTVQEYFTDPGNILTNLAISTVHFGASRMYNQIAGSVAGSRASKAWDAYNAVGDKTSVEAANAYKKAVKLNAKAQKYADNAWKRGMSFEKAAKNVDLSNKMVDEAVRNIFKANSWDFDYAGKTKRFSSKEEYLNFIKDELMPTKDGLFTLANSTNIKAINNYYMFKTQIGTAINEVGNIPKSARLKLLNTINDVYKANIEEIKAGKGTFEEKNHELYSRMRDAAIEANNAGEYGVKIRNLEKSLNGFFGNLEEMAKVGNKEGVLNQLRLGYIPTSSLYFDGSYDDMIQSHRMAATRGLLYAGESVDVAAANPAEARDLYNLDTLLTAMNKGDTTFDVKDAEGNVIKTVQLDYDGTNLIDMMTTYSNNYNLHKYIDPVMGDNRTEFGRAWLQNNHAYIMGDYNMVQKAWNRDFARAKAKFTGMDTKKGRVKGWYETILPKAVEQKVVTDAQAKEIRKNGSVKINVKAADEEKLAKLRNDFSAANKKMKAAKAIIDNGDAPNSVYPLISSVFNLDIDGVPNVKEAEVIFDNGRKVANLLVKAYTNGEINEGSLKTGYTIKTRSGYRDIFIDEIMLDKLDAAAKSGQVDSDLIFYSAVQNENAAPYKSKATSRGITTKEFVPDYVNRLIAKPKGLSVDAKDVNLGKLGDYNVYSGYIKPGDKDTIFVFGSNPEGRHGAGAAKIAMKKFGAKYGQGEGLQGNSYALPTKDLRVKENNGLRSISPEDITKNIKKMYATAEKNPNKKFMVAYSSDDNLNGYSLKEMANMFKGAGRIPDNVYFSKAMGEILSGKIDNEAEVVSANHAKAVEVFGNNKGEVTFGSKEIKDARTGKVTVTGGKTVEAVDFYSTEMRLGRNETGDVVEKTSESRIKLAEEVSESSLYASVDTKLAKGKYAPTDFQKRYAESVISRTKTELADSPDSFNGSEWILAIDKNAGDPRLVKMYGVDNDSVYTSTSKDGTKSTKNTNLAQQVMSLEQAGALGAFRYNLEVAASRVGSGELDGVIPDGMTRAELVDNIVKARDFMNSAEQYGYHAKKSQQLGTEVDEEGNLLDATDAYSDIAYSNLRGDNVQIYNLQGRIIDLDYSNVEDHLKAFKFVMNAYADESNPLHDVFTSDELKELSARRINFSKKTTDIAGKINDEAKALYDSGNNPEFNKIVDQTYQNIVARSSKYGGKTNGDEIKYQYLEALGIAAPGSGLNPMGTGSYGQTPGRYYAARLAQAEGIEDTSVEGWSSAVTKMRLDAGTNAGYAKQLAEGVRRLQQYSGETDATIKIKNDADSVVSTISSLSEAKPFGAEDNFENSAMAMFADVYDRKAMSPVANKAEAEQNVRDAKWRLENLVSEALLGKKARTEGMTVIKVNETANEVGKTSNSMINDLVNFYQVRKNYTDTEYFVQYGKHDSEAYDTGMDLPTATRLYEDELDSFFAKYGKEGETVNDFESRMLSIQNQAKKLSNDYNNMREEYAAMGGSNVVAPSTAQGKASIFTPEQLSYAAVKPVRTWTPGENSFEAKIGGETVRLTPEFDFGTAQELSDTAVGMRLINSVGDEVDLKNLTPEEAKAVMASLNESLGNSGLTIIHEGDNVVAKQSKGLPLLDEKGKVQFDENGEIKRITQAEIQARLKEIGAQKKVAAEKMKTAREFGDLSENAEYSAAIDEMKALQNEEDSLKGMVTSGGQTSDYDVLQDLGNGYYLAGTSREDEPLRDITASRSEYEESPEELSSRALAKYTEYTSNYNPAKQIAQAKKDYKSASKELERLKKRGEAVSNKIKKNSMTLEKVAKEVLTDEEFSKFQNDLDEYKALKSSKPTKDTNFYHAANGKYMILAGEGSQSPGYVSAQNLLNMLGYDAKNFNHDISEGRVYSDEEIAKDFKQRKKMMKEVNKNLRAGNVRYRNVQQYQNPSALDLKSYTATINNILAFCDQVSKATATKRGEIMDANKIMIDKDTSDLLFRISREGIQSSGVKDYLKGAAFELSDWNKFIQDFQLAGGASYINAMTIAQMRGAILSNPTKMAEYLKLVVDFKDDAAVANFVVNNGQRLSEIAMKVQDSSILTDFQASASDKPWMEDAGTLSAATYRMIDSYDASKSGNRAGFGEKYEFAKDAIQHNVDALFTDATFNRMLPVLRAKMLIANYDNAVRTLKRHFKNIDGETLADAAAKYSYARTTAFFEPNKTSGGFFRNKSINQTLQNIADDNLRKFLSSWTGAKDTISIGQMASNCFFALGYKQRMIQPLFQGAKSTFGIGNILDRLSMLKAVDDATPDLLNKLGTQFMQAGNRQQIRSLAVIAIGAFITAKSLGLATAWDDLSFTDDADGEFKVPDILKKFQTVGQIWIPNSFDENGRPYIDPTKPAFNIDTMSSIFTLPNTFWKTVDRTFNPNASYTAPQRGFGLFGQELGINSQGLNDFINQPWLRAIGDELIGSNLLSPYKAMYEVLVDSSYYGNNIWEKKWLSDGSENPNYDPVRNIKASFFHILGLDNYRTLSPRKYNDYVKGYYTDDYVAQDQIGSISGSGILQHEYITAVINIMEGDALEGIIEAGELPIKKQTFSSAARTDFNTRVKNIIAEAMAEYNNKTAGETDADVKDAAYADAVQKSANAVASWSKKYGYVLGRDQSLVPYVTRSMMAVLAGEYDDRLDYIQNTYWKASQIAQIEATGPAGYWLDDNDVDAWIESGKTAEEFAEEKNKRHEAYNQALDDEYKARKALHDAGIDNEYLAGMSIQNLKSEQRAVNRAAYTQAMGIVNSKVGEFDNFKEMKAYYESQIDAATTKKAKAKLANQYNTYLTDALAPVVEKYGAGIISDGYYNSNYLSNHLADYVIIPADKYYTGKTPRASYLRDLFGVGYRDFSNEPSDDEVIEGYTNAFKQMQAGNSASAVAALDRTIDAIKKGQLHVTDADYSKIIRMRALLSARSK